MELSVLKQLESLTPIEKQQKEHQIFSDDIPTTAIDLQESKEFNVPVLNDYFFRNHAIYVSKHNRFAPYPLHTHQFFEMNYMLQGNANETVDGDRIHLSQGDVLLLDIGSEHSIDALGENDILINVLFRDRNISLDFLNQIQSQQSVLYDFLINHLREKKTEKRYMIFRSGMHDIRTSLERIIEEYFRPRPFSDTIIQAELTVLIAELIRGHEPTIADPSPSQKLAVELLHDIHEHYRNLSLEELANKYAYNKNYLGNLFSKEVGKTFSEALTQERLINARRLIQNTKKPISEICLEVGISNKSFFYHKYHDLFGNTPKDDRQHSNGYVSLNHTTPPLTTL
ncbi:helix-turn-helix domain-containing protein [Lacticaseibacillus chiayiensis]|uniref:helix-turn-helix domain-containing protein n=1 Tax=Lacticaseibacillus chiayiensis TaxID=2100821 RepID=UPI001013939A|nr:helix-turn-helix domain-containing protein [Lacticaseibacillus chiayiensis]RXT58289.1 AraC family transcriptional regulator [Lacticaseibacillus chiayiensis]